MKFQIYEVSLSELSELHSGQTHWNFGEVFFFEKKCFFLKHFERRAQWNFGIRSL